MAWFTEGSATYYGSSFEPDGGQLRWKPATILRKPIRTRSGHGETITRIAHLVTPTPMTIAQV